MVRSVLARTCSFVLAASLVFGPLATIPAARADDGSPLFTPEEKARLEQVAGGLKDLAKAGSGKEEDMVQVAALAMGPYGGVLLGMWKIFSLFAKPSGPDPFKAIHEQLQILQNKIKELQTEIVAVKDEVRAGQNAARRAWLVKFQEDVKTILGKLADNQDNPKALEPLARDVLGLANTIYKSEDNWQWSPRKGEHYQNAQWQPHPILETYILTLATFIRTLSLAYGNDPKLLKQRYADALHEHANHLSLRQDWVKTTETSGPDKPFRENEDSPKSIPENIMNRVHCWLAAGDKYVDKQGNCTFYETCLDHLSGFEFGVPKAKPVKLFVDKDQMTMCTVSDKKIVEYEHDLEAFHGVLIGEKYVKVLRQLATSGAVGEQYVGRFDMRITTAEILYGIAPDGDLYWHKHIVTSGPKPEVEPAKSKTLGTLDAKKATAVSILAAQNADKTKAKPATGMVDAARKITTLQKLTTGPEWAYSDQWEGPKKVGNGWQQFCDILPAGMEGMYGLTKAGVLKWYRHDGANTGDDKKWKGPVDVATGLSCPPKTGPYGNNKLATAAKKSIASALGTETTVRTIDGKNASSTLLQSKLSKSLVSGPDWRSTVKLIPGGDGVFYAVQANGDLLWYRHLGFRDDSQKGKWEGWSKIGNGWGDFVHLFSSTEGYLYGIKADGKVHWYHHTGVLDGKPTWDKNGGKVVKEGFPKVKSVFSPDLGTIYAVSETGELLWFKHNGYKDGSGKLADWKGPFTAATGWDRFLFVIPQMAGVASYPVVR